MKKALVLFAIIMIVLLAGCITETKKEDILPMKDCGEDQECFREATKNCQRAKYIQKVGEGSNETILYSEVRGSEADKCITYTKMEKQGKTSKETIDAEGYDMVCKVSKQALKEDKYTEDDVECIGPLVEPFRSTSRIVTRPENQTQM